MTKNEKGVCLLLRKEECFVFGLREGNVNSSSCRAGKNHSKGHDENMDKRGAGLSSHPVHPFVSYYHLHTRPRREV